MEQQSQILNTTALKVWCAQRHTVIVPAVLMICSHLIFSVGGLLTVLLSAALTWFSMEYYKRYKQ